MTNSRQADWSPTEIAAHLAAALQLLAEQLRRIRRPVPGWVAPFEGLLRRWADTSSTTTTTTSSVQLDPPPRLLTLEQVGHLLGDVSESTVRRVIHEGRLKIVHVTPQTPRVRVEDLDAFLSTLDAPTTQSAPVSASQRRSAPVSAGQFPTALQPRGTVTSMAPTKTAPMPPDTDPAARLDALSAELDGLPAATTTARRSGDVAEWMRLVTRAEDLPGEIAQAEADLLAIELEQAWAAVDETAAAHRDAVQAYDKAADKRLEIEKSTEGVRNGRTTARPTTQWPSAEDAVKARHALEMATVLVWRARMDDVEAARQILVRALAVVDDLEARGAASYDRPLPEPLTRPTIERGFDGQVFTLQPGTRPPRWTAAAAGITPEFIAAAIAPEGHVMTISRHQRRRIAVDHGLPADLGNRLQGDTVEEITAHAEQVAGVIRGH
jgi:hypothetical protein